MLGRLGTEALAAVGYVTQYFYLGLSIFLAVGAVCVALMARSIGGGDAARARAGFAACMILQIGFALVFTGAIFAAPEPLLRVLGAAESTIELALPYFKLTLASSLLMAVSFTIESAFRATKDARTPLLVTGFVTASKLVLNALLIFGLFGFPKLDLVGAGIATLVSQFVGVLLFLWLSQRRRAAAVMRLRRRDWQAARGVFREATRLALPAIGERAAMNLAILVYFAVLVQYGSVAIAAYTVGVRVLSFSWIPGIGFSVAAATLVGQALGASDLEEAKRAGWRSTRFALMVSVGLGIVYAVARVPIARLFTTDPLVIDALVPFMLLLALAQPLLGLHFTLGGALRGAGDTLSPFWGSLVGNWVFRVPLAFLFARVLDWDVIWVWSALVFDHLARSAWVIWAFLRGRWRTKLGVELEQAA